MARITGVNTLADLIDRLIVEVNRLAYFENQKRQEHAKNEPNNGLIVKWDSLSRDSCELRSLLKTEINACMREIVETGIYAPPREPRTFRPGRFSVEEILDEICAERSGLNTLLARSLEDTLKS